MQDNGNAHNPLSSGSDIHELRVARRAMACLFEVIFNVGDHAEATEWAVEALDLVEQVEDRFTVYRESSELIRLNGAARIGAAHVAPDLMRLLQRARDLHAWTGWVSTWLPGGWCEPGAFWHGRGERRRKNCWPKPGPSLACRLSHSMSRPHGSS